MFMDQLELHGDRSKAITTSSAKVRHYVVDNRDLLVQDQNILFVIDH